MGVHGHGLSVGHAMTNAVMLDLAPLPVSAVETQERMIAPMKVLHVIDYIFRGMALVWLLPFMYLWFVLSINRFIYFCINKIMQGSSQRIWFPSFRRSF